MRLGSILPLPPGAACGVGPFLVSRDMRLTKVEVHLTWRLSRPRLTA